MPSIEIMRSALADAAPATPACPHFGECGGCAFQDIAYADQVRMKQAYLENMFGLPVDVAPSPSPYGYRQRMDYVFAFGQAGLRKRGRKWEVIELQACPLVPPRVFDVFSRLRAHARQSGIADYDYRRHEGVLRYLVFRHAATTDKLFVNVIATADDPTLSPLLELARELAEGVAVCVTTQRADVSQAPVTRVLGVATIHERIGGMTFAFGPTTFAQNNAALAERLYAHVVERCAGPTLDLYTGVGVIACLAARHVPHVWGVEIVEESVALARENARRNTLDNVEFTCAPVRPHLHALVQAGFEAQTIVLDPPRSGTAKKIIARIEALRPERVLYVSCNPSALATELSWLADYKLVRMAGFDLFPHTPHVEVVAELARR